MSSTSPQPIANLYRDYHGWLRAWIRRRLNSEEACDLAQDVFVRVMLQRNSVELREPKAYLSSIARNLLVDTFRHRSIEQAYVDTLALHAEMAQAPSPEEHHQIIQVLLEIDRLLDSLGKRPRDIFLKVQLDGLSMSEVGRQMGLSGNTVRKHFIRAMAKCLLLLDD